MHRIVPEVVSVLDFRNMLYGTTSGTVGLPDLLGTKVGRLVAAQFADPTRLAALGVTRFVRFAATRDLIVRRGLAERVVAAARDALPTTEGVIARRVLAADLALLADLDGQITAGRSRTGPVAARQPVPTLDQRARLGHRPRRQLRCRAG
jgi:hypothetical protein